MKVFISGRKVPDETSTSHGEERVPFEHVIKECTVIFIAVPLITSTNHLISKAEFDNMSRQSILINVSRGGVVDEEALVAALKEDRIAGAATDVFREEPAGVENSPLLGEDTKHLNLTVTPHMAWLAGMTWKVQSEILQKNVEQWVAGNQLNVIV